MERHGGGGETAPAIRRHSAAPTGIRRISSAPRGRGSAWHSAVVECGKFGLARFGGRLIDDLPNVKAYVKHITALASRDQCGAAAAGGAAAPTAQLQAPLYWSWLFQARLLMCPLVSTSARRASSRSFTRQA